MKREKKSAKSKAHFIEVFSFTKINYILFAIGLVVIILGYIVMATGDTYSFQSLSLAPIILLIGYLVIIPISILYRKKEKSQQSPTEK